MSRRVIETYFRRAAFVEALDAQREREGMSWRAVAAATECSPSTLTRMVAGADPDMRTFARLAAWLREDIRPFFVGATQTKSPQRADVQVQMNKAIEAVERIAGLVSR